MCLPALDYAAVHLGFVRNQEDHLAVAVARDAAARSPTPRRTSPTASPSSSPSTHVVLVLLPKGLPRASPPPGVYSPVKTPTPLFYPCPARPSELPNYALARAALPLTPPRGLAMRATRRTPVAVLCRLHRRLARAQRPRPPWHAHAARLLSPTPRAPTIAAAPCLHLRRARARATPFARRRRRLARAARRPPLLAAASLPPTRPLDTPRPPVAALLPLL
nr:extensin-like [Aegilops tauschii subsp. strangulata]